MKTLNVEDVRVNAWMNDCADTPVGDVCMYVCMLDGNLKIICPTNYATCAMSLHESKTVKLCLPVALMILT